MRKSLSENGRAAMMETTEPRACGHLPQCKDCGGDVPSCAVACIGFVVSCVHSSELLDLAEIVFDEVSPFVGFGVVRDVQDAVALGRNDSIGTPAMQVLAQVVCIKRFVRCPLMVCLQTMRGGHQGFEGQPLDQGRHAGNFAALTRKKRKAHQIAERVRQRQHLGRQPAF